MIIVSQDKKAVINFNNTITLELKEHIANMDGERETMIVAVCDNDKAFVLAYYETEERAKEILEDITNTKAIFEIYKSSNADTQDIFDEKMLKENLIFDTYEMPEE